VAVVVPFEKEPASIEAMVRATKADMDRVNAMILSRTGSEVTMIPEVANHLISPGGKRRRPMLTLATASLAGYRGDGQTGGGPGGGGGGAGQAQQALTKLPAYDKFSAYYNIDNGTGKIRGVYLQGNDAVQPIFKQWLSAFRDPKWYNANFDPNKDLNMGANTLTLSNTGGTDHLAFDAIGLPGFQFIQDAVEYDTRTHHSNMDVFDRIQADDMKQMAVILATFVYQTAMMDQKIPRKVMP